MLVNNKRLTVKQQKFFRLHLSFNCEVLNKKQVFVCIPVVWIKLWNEIDFWKKKKRILKDASKWLKVGEESFKWIFYNFVHLFRLHMFYHCSWCWWLCVVYNQLFNKLVKIFVHQPILWVVSWFVIFSI